MYTESKVPVSKLTPSKQKADSDRAGKTAGEKANLFVYKMDTEDVCVGV